MKCLFVSDTKNEHLIKLPPSAPNVSWDLRERPKNITFWRGSVGPLWDTKIYQLLKRASWSPTSDRKSQHFLMVEIKRKILDLSISAEIDWSKFVPRCFNLPVLRSSQKFEQQYPILGEHWTSKARRENTPKCSHLNCILAPRTHPRPRRPYRRALALWSWWWSWQDTRTPQWQLPPPVSRGDELPRFLRKRKNVKGKQFHNMSNFTGLGDKVRRALLCGKEFGLKTS